MQPTPERLTVAPFAFTFCYVSLHTGFALKKPSTAKNVNEAHKHMFIGYSVGVAFSTSTVAYQNVDRLLATNKVTFYTCRKKLNVFNFGSQSTAYILQCRSAVDYVDGSCLYHSNVHALFTTWKFPHFTPKSTTFRRRPLVGADEAKRLPSLIQCSV
jgi:hypothetical protein